MKCRLTVLALAIVLMAQTASAQRSRERDNTDDNARIGQPYNQQDHYRNTPDRSTGRVRNNPRSRAVMSERAFGQAMEALRDERFDSDRIILARVLAARNNMTTLQIKTMAQVFSFDSSKLEFTKYAYASCVDKEYYYQIGRIFSFSSSRQELYDYLARV